MFTTHFAFALLLLTPLLMPVYVAAQDKPAAAANTLTDAQQQALQKALQTVENAGKSEAVTLAAKIGDIAKSFDRNILAEKPDAALDSKLSDQLIAAVGDVVIAAMHAKLNGVHEIVKVLTPEQKKLLLAELDKPDTNPDLTDLVGKVFGEQKKQ